MKPLKVQWGITLGALLTIAVHLIWPSLAIDGITLVLIVVAIVPWLAPLFKSMEFPGGWKIEFRDLAKVQERAEQANLLAPATAVDIEAEYPFQIVAEDDPNLALAGLRIEIEKRLRRLAQSANIPIYRTSVDKLMHLLYQKGVLNQDAYGVLADMIGLLNQAVHGAEVDKRALDWAMEVGPRILKALDEHTASEAVAG